MIQLLGVDEDWSKVDPAAAWAAGYRFAIGYVSQDTTGKNLTRPQIDALHAVGFKVGLVFEYNPQSAAGGAAAGTRDAGIAIQVARALGTPAGVALYTAIDWQVPSSQLGTVLAYANAFRAACLAAGYRSGAYADYAVCAYLAQHGYGGFLWQTYAWSGTPPTWWAGDALRQTLNGIHVAGATVDKDLSLVDDWGQWEAEMALRDDQDFLALIYRVVTLMDGSKTVEAGPTAGESVWLVATVADIQAKLAALSAPAPVDTHALATDLMAQLTAAGYLTEASAHTLIKSILDTKLGAAAAA